MKRLLYIFLCSLAYIVALGVIIAFVSPTLGRQVAFHKCLWHHYPAPKIRYYMSDSLLVYLDAQKPDYSKTHQLLGEDFWDTWPDFVPDPLDPPRELIYVLKTAPIMGLRIWILVINFDEQGNYQSSCVVEDD